MSASTALALRRAASPWRRIVARLLDAAVVFMLLWMLAVVQLLWFMGDLADRTSVGPWGRALAPTVAFVVLAVAYETVFLACNKGQTPGKDVMNVRVSGREADLTPRAAGLRSVLINAVWLVPAPAVALVALVCVALVVACGPRAGWHDAVSGTRVVPYDRSAEDPDAPPRPTFLRTRERGVRVDPPTVEAR